MATVRELLRSKAEDLVGVNRTATLDEAVDLLLRRGVGGLVVADDGGRLVGFISERDVVAALRAHGGNFRRTPVTAAMRPPPTCGPDDPVPQVMMRMTRDRLRHLVVVEAGRAIGVVSVGDIVKQRLVELETEAGVLRDYVAGQRVSL